MGPSSRQQHIFKNVHFNSYFKLQIKQTYWCLWLIYTWCDCS